MDEEGVKVRSTTQLTESESAYNEAEKRERQRSGESLQEDRTRPVLIKRSGEGMQKDRTNVALISSLSAGA